MTCSVFSYSHFLTLYDLNSEKFIVFTNFNLKYYKLFIYIVIVYK